MSDDIARTTRRIIKESLGFYKGEGPADDEPLVPKFGDSLHIVEIVMSLEDEFGIEIPDPDFLQKMNTIAQFTEYITAKKKPPITGA